MQKLHNISKWTRMVEGGSLRFESVRPRMIRLEVNSPDSVRFYLLDMENETSTFLATTFGRETLEFFVGGPFVLTSDAEAYVYTADGERAHHVAVDPVIFTRITERRTLPPEIRAIQEMMQINVERRLAAQRDEFNAILRRVQPVVRPTSRSQVAAAAATNEPTAAGDAAGFDAASGDGGQSPEPAAGDPPKRKGK